MIDTTIHIIQQNSAANSDLAWLKAEVYKVDVEKLKTVYTVLSKLSNVIINVITQNCLVFQPVSRYFKTVANTSKVTAWESKGLSNEGIKPPSTFDNSLKPGLSYFDNSRIRIIFNGNCLRPKIITFTHKQVANIYFVYEINL